MAKIHSAHFKVNLVHLVALGVIAPPEGMPREEYCEQLKEQQKKIKKDGSGKKNYILTII